MTRRWKLLHRTLKLESKWVTVYADKLLNNMGEELEYWHYDRPDSVVVIAIHNDNFVLPAPQYRVGMDDVLLDFAGSRVDSGKSPADAATQVLCKELGISSTQIQKLESLNKEPFAVDSSFSTQKLWGYVAYIENNAILTRDHQIYALNAYNTLRKKLHCAQCRVLLSEFILNQSH